VIRAGDRGKIGQQIGVIASSERGAEASQDRGVQVRGQPKGRDQRNQESSGAVFGERIHRGRFNRRRRGEVADRHCHGDGCGGDIIDGLKDVVATDPQSIECCGGAMARPTGRCDILLHLLGDIGHGGGRARNRAARDRATISVVVAAGQRWGERADTECDGEILDPGRASAEMPLIIWRRRLSSPGCAINIPSVGQAITEGDDGTEWACVRRMSC
jgi:hypothetical protein